MSGFSFGTPQTTTSVPSFGFGSPATQQAPTQQPAPSFGFGTPSTTPAASVPTLAPTAAAIAPIAPIATTTSGLSFGLSAPPYGSQTTTAAAPSAFSFGLGTTGTAATR